MKKLFFICIMALVLLAPGILVVSCQQPELTATEQEIVQGAREAISKLDTYQFNFDMVLTVTNEEGQATYLVVIYGAVDEVERKMHDTQQISFEEVSGYSGENNYEMYLLGDWRYLKSDDKTWNKSQSEYYWDSNDYASIQLDLLKELAPLALTSIDTINEVECYKLELKPDKETLWNWIVNQGWSQVLEGAEQELTEDIVTDYSIFQWITKDTYFLNKSTEDITMIVNGNTIVYKKTVLIHHFNEPVSIEIPQEAES